MLDFGRLLDPQLLMSAELLVDPGLIQNKFKPVQDNISSFFFIHFLLLESVGSKMNLENNNRKIEDREVLESHACSLITNSTFLEINIAFPLPTFTRDSPARSYQRSLTISSSVFHLQIVR